MNIKNNGPIKSTAPYRTHGKLLLTGEYLVLDGALVLALPLRYGQTMTVTPADQPSPFSWKSYGHRGQLWFEARVSVEGIIEEASDDGIGQRLQQLFNAIRRLRPDFWSEQAVQEINTTLDFPRSWGLGTSSTLVAGLAQWAGVDAFRLLERSFGGSGYDIACALSDGPVLFQRRNGQPQWVNAPYAPPFADQLYFVYLGQKQDSRAGIQHYREMGQVSDGLLQNASDLTMGWLQARTVEELQAIIEEHEALISSIIQLPTVQAERFPDFAGSVKSLGAWGGDFVLAASALEGTEVVQYFEGKGHEVCLPWTNMLNRLDASGRFPR